MTPEQEDQVRRALASLPTQPMPPEVAARLEARLAELQAERRAGARPVDADPDPAGEPWSTTGPTGDPAGRNRRWPTLLVAAALLAVVGVGIGSVLDDLTGSGDMESMTAGGQAANDTAEEGEPRPMESAPEEEAPLAEAPSADGQYNSLTRGVTGRMVLTEERVELHSETLEDDVVDFINLGLPRAAADDEVLSQRAERLAAAKRLRRLFSPCTLPSTGRGDQLVAVRLDEAPATLVLREPRDGTRVAQVYSCVDPSQVLGRTRVDAR